MRIAVIVALFLLLMFILGYEQYEQQQIDCTLVMYMRWHAEVAYASH